MEALTQRESEKQCPTVAGKAVTAAFPANPERIRSQEIRSHWVSAGTDGLWKRAYKRRRGGKRFIILKPDISILVEIGHFYFGLTKRGIEIDLGGSFW